MSPIAEKWKDIGVDIPSLLPLQAVPQEPEPGRMLSYLQALHNYLAGDRQVVVRAINVLSRFRMFMADDEDDMPDGTTDDDTVVVVGDTPPVIHVCPPHSHEYVPVVPEYNQITQEPTGFLNPGKAASTMGITGTDFFIEPTGDDYTVYYGGLKYVKTTQETLDLTPANAEGNWFIYFDGATGALVLDGTVTLEDILRDNIFVAELYHDGSSLSFMGEERHGLMVWQSHIHSHIADGTIWREGLGLTGMVVDGDGNTDSHAEMNAELGVIMDEDIIENLPAMTGNWDTLARVSNAWIFENTGANSPVKLTVGVPQWNDVSGAGVLTDVTANRYFLMHIFASHIVTDGAGTAVSGHVAFIGQAEYLTKNQAREGANYEISNLITTGLPMPEYVPYATVIFKRGGTNAYNAAVVSTDTGEDYINWLGAEIQPGNPPSSHNNLTQRDLPQQHPAASVEADVTNFDEELSAADTDVQLALDTLDAHEHALGLGPLNYIDLDTSYADGSQEGRLQWNIEDGVPEVGLPGGNVTMQIGQEMPRRCRNTTGTLIPNGSVVHIVGSSGNKPLIALSRADVKTTAIVYGVTTEAIAHNANGYVTTIGLVRDMDTSLIAEGGFAFLSESTAGALVATPPEAPSFKTVIGTCLRQHASAGVLDVKVGTANQLKSLSDVYGTPLEGYAPTWVAANSRFEMLSLAPASHTHLEADVTDLDHDDLAAIHDDVAGEIHALSLLSGPSGYDKLIIEDADDSWNKKAIEVGDIGTFFGGSYDESTATDFGSIVDNKSYGYIAVGTIIVENNTGSTLNKGDVCYISGDDTGVPEVTLADADAAATATGELVVIEDTTIGTAASGNAKREGLITGLSGFTANTVQYLSTTAGGTTETAPGSGKFVRVLGYSRLTTEFMFMPDMTWIEVA